MAVVWTHASCVGVHTTPALTSSQGLEEAEHQRDVSLDYVSEQAGKVAEAMLKAEEADRAAADASRRAALAEENQRVRETLHRRSPRVNAYACAPFEVVSHHHHIMLVAFPLHN